MTRPDLLARVKAWAEARPIAEINALPLYDLISARGGWRDVADILDAAALLIERHPDVVSTIWQTPAPSDDSRCTRLCVRAWLERNKIRASEDAARRARAGKASQHAADSRLRVDGRARGLSDRASRRLVVLHKKDDSRRTQLKDGVKQCAALHKAAVASGDPGDLDTAFRAFMAQAQRYRNWGHLFRSADV